MPQPSILVSLAAQGYPLVQSLHTHLWVVSIRPPSHPLQPCTPRCLEKFCKGEGCEAIALREESPMPDPLSIRQVRSMSRRHIHTLDEGNSPAFEAGVRAAGEFGAVSNGYHRSAALQSVCL